jgi:hypothetical protein
LRRGSGAAQRKQQVWRTSKRADDDANPINRYLINSPMLPELRKNADGSLDALHPEGFSRQGARIQLAPGAQRSDLPGDAPVLAEGHATFDPAAGQRNVAAAGYVAKGGTGVLKVDGKVVATRKIPHAVAFLWPRDETFDVGIDTRTPIQDKDYQVPFAFNGKINKLTFNLGPERMLAEDLEKMRAAALKAD